MMTVEDLIDSLGQFDPKTPIVRSVNDVSEPGEFIALDCIDMDYTVEESAR